MIRVFYFFLIFTSFHCFAQKDYTITISGDTIFGKVRRGNLNNNKVTISNNNGKQKIHLQEIKEWKTGNMPVTVVKLSKGKKTYWLELLLVVDGNKKLFRDLFHITENRHYYTLFKGKYVQLTQVNMNKFLEDELMQCKLFSEKYKKIKIYQSKLQEVVLFYNENCK